MPFITRKPTEEDLAEQATQAASFAVSLSHLPGYVSLLLMLTAIPAAAFHFAFVASDGLAEPLQVGLSTVAWLASIAVAVKFGGNTPDADANAICAQFLRGIEENKDRERSVFVSSLEANA
jgi:hypothetical protein